MGGGSQRVVCAELPLSDLTRGAAQIDRFDESVEVCRGR